MHPLYVLVSMMEIRRMWVRVSDGLVVVRMGMTHRGRDTGVHVAMVAVVVAVAVCV